MLTTNRYFVVLVSMVLAALTAGCATVGDQRVDILYQGTVGATGASGDLYLVEEKAPAPVGTTSIQWVLGGITNKDGEKLGNVVTDTSPNDVIAGAFLQELKGAGYHVVHQSSLPKEVEKGLVLKSATIKLDEIKTPLNVEVKCKVAIAIEPWRNGQATNKLEYEADYTETAVTGRDELLSKTLSKAIQLIMTRSVPEIVKKIELK